MTGARFKEAQEDFNRANHAQELQQSWMLSFQAACQRHDWVEAEMAQANALAAMDAFCCHYVAGHKRMETA